MTTSISPLMPDQIIECISTGRDPTVRELFEVAERMWTDGAAGRSAFSWGRLPPGSNDRLLALRGAQLALSGNRDPAYDGSAKETIMAKDAGEDADLRLPLRNPDWSADVTTQSGYTFHLRRASHVDEVALSEFSEQFDSKKLGSRFLASSKNARERQDDATSDPISRRTENFLAIERNTDRIIAAAGIAIGENPLDASAALVIRPEYKSGGIRWKLLEHIAHFAVANGVQTLEAIEDRGNHDSPDLDHRPGWIAFSYQNDPTLTVWRKSVDQA